MKNRPSIKLFDVYKNDLDINYIDNVNKGEKWGDKYTIEKINNSKLNHYAKDKAIKIVKAYLKEAQ